MKLSDDGDEDSGTPSKPDVVPDSEGKPGAKTPDTADCSKFVDAVFKPVFQAAWYDLSEIKKTNFKSYSLPLFYEMRMTN